MKKFLPTLILLLLVYGWYFLFYQHSHPQELNVLGAKTNLMLYEQPDSGHQPLVDALDSAQKEILVEVYLLSDKEIIQALKDAHDRGVKVMVMMEQHPFGGSGLNPKTKKELDADGIQTNWSNSSFALTHAKFIVVDQALAFILSQNLTASAFSKNREYDILDTNSVDVTEIRNIFISDWDRKSFSPPQDTNVIESPDNSRAALTTLVTNTTQKIDAETEDINDTRFINILSEKAQSEKVRLLVPTLSQLAANGPALQKLQQAGVEVRTISSPYMHAKMIIADDKKAYVGSINFSSQSMDENRELGIIITQDDILQTLSTTFEEDWNKGTLFTTN